VIQQISFQRTYVGGAKKKQENMAEDVAIGSSSYE
jgi:hypothetical protein